MSDPDSDEIDLTRERTVSDTLPLAHPGDIRSTADGAGTADGATGARSPSEILSLLADYRTGLPRYRVVREIERGGMGVILHVSDDTLSRSLAMKIMLDRGSEPVGREPSGDDNLLLARFLEEAQVTGQLDHPGIVPLHELGVDAEGRVFFTMKLVEGRNLRDIFDLIFDGKEDWNETRTLGVLLKACEAMTYAHAKGVVHRDLKPANVMVGNFGEVYVMDWGLARVTGRKDKRDLRLRPVDPSTSSLQTDRRKEREESPDSPLVTMDGHVMGTPAYMPPEQATGNLESVGPRSDVYSIGAMLYHLLARQMPYVPPGARMSNRTVLGLVVNGPPAPLTSLRRDVPAELAAIVEKAMARDGARRYASTIELADDLRAYLERRVVKAYETGSVAELRKWIVRNKPLAATIGSIVLAIVAGAIVINDARVEARHEKEHVLRLSDVQRLKDLETDAATLWPAYPEQIAGIEGWLGRARDLGSRLEQHRARLAALREKALPWDEQQQRLDRETHADAPLIASLHEDKKKAEEALSKLDTEKLEKEEDGNTPGEIHVFLTKTTEEIASLETEIDTRRTWKFEETEDDWQHGLIAGLVAGIENLARDDNAWHALTTASLERRLEFARTLRQKTIEDERAAWDAAIAAIATSEKYYGLLIAPQLGLVPIGEDPESHLFEFWHVQSGERPVRGADRRIVPHEKMGIVLVLVPGGSFMMGSPETVSERRQHEKQHEVKLDAFFISKYEMTQGQWERFVGRNPSQYRPPTSVGSHAITLLNPVESVSYRDCAHMLRQLGLDFPTEVQWECAARGGTVTRWWLGDDKELLREKVNIADKSFEAIAGNTVQIDLADNDDGYMVHAPIGTFPANPFGLHEVIGNVWEWCRDWYGPYELPTASGHNERLVPYSRRDFRIYRGGSFFSGTSYGRSAFRSSDPPTYHDSLLGLRPAKDISIE